MCRVLSWIFISINSLNPHNNLTRLRLFLFPYRGGETSRVIRVIQFSAGKLEFEPGWSDPTAHAMNHFAVMVNNASETILSENHIPIM